MRERNGTYVTHVLQTAIERFENLEILQLSASTVTFISMTATECRLQLMKATVVAEKFLNFQAFLQSLAVCRHEAGSLTLFSQFSHFCVSMLF